MRENLHFTEGTCVESLTTRKKSSNNTSGHRGVSCITKDNTYKAEITIKCKRYYLGTFKNLDYAVQARLKGEEMFTDFFDEYYTKQKEIADS